MRDPNFYTKVPKIQPREEYEKDPKPSPRNVVDDYGRAKINAAGIVAKFPFASLMKKSSTNFLGRENEVNAVVETLYKKRMRNCILVGPAGVGKTEIAKKAIQKLDRKEVFVNVELSNLIADCTLVGQFEDRMGGFLRAIVSNNDGNDVKISLFIDEIHSLWKLNEHTTIGTVSAPNILKPYLSDGSVTIIGATTDEEYRRFAMTDKALLRRISPIFIRELGDDQTFSIVKDFCQGELSDELIAQIIKKSKTLNYLHNPDKSIEIADRLMARAYRLKRLASTKDLEDIIQEMEDASDAAL